MILSINKLLNVASVRDQLAFEGIASVQVSSPEFLATFLQVEIAKWHEVIRNSGAKEN